MVNRGLAMVKGSRSRSRSRSMLYMIRCRTFVVRSRSRIVEKRGYGMVNGIQDGVDWTSQMVESTVIGSLAQVSFLRIFFFITYIVQNWILISTNISL